MYYNTCLDNGIDVIAEKVENVRSISLGIWVKSGSRYENSSTHGISHFIEHMLFKGTKRRGPREIANEIDDISAEMNAFTAREYTCVFFKVIDEYFEKALDILSDIFLNPLFPKEELEREREVILEEIKMYNDTPEELVHDLTLEACFEGHPLELNVLGNEESVGSFKREDLMAYYNDVYVGESIVISVAGNIEPERATSLIEENFQGAKKSSNILPDRDSYFSIFESNDKYKKKDIEQVHYSLAFPGISYPDERIYQMNLLNNILGGSMSSRLFQDIRENSGLAYSICSYPLAFQDNGVLIVYAGVSPEKVAELGEKIWKNVEDISGEKSEARITLKELERSRAQLKGSLIFSLESTNSRMIRLGYSKLLKGQALDPDEIIEKINKIEVSHLESLVRELTDHKKIASALIGPLEDNYNKVEKGFVSDVSG